MQAADAGLAGSGDASANCGGAVVHPDGRWALSPKGVIWHVRVQQGRSVDVIVQASPKFASRRPSNRAPTAPTVHCRVTESHPPRRLPNAMRLREPHPACGQGMPRQSSRCVRLRTCFEFQGPRKIGAMAFDVQNHKPAARGTEMVGTILVLASTNLNSSLLPESSYVDSAMVRSKSLRAAVFGG
ncbi:hypothetical protein IQ07DRAFT_20863 [Pyrenochaeta sp. DS3sAY3a]|nr:hypothetical protein IQ07DRAFT_20863 [Pyrenochaeta sp. DS3sAY3a]